MELILVQKLVVAVVSFAACYTFLNLVSWFKNDKDSKEEKQSTRRTIIGAIVTMLGIAAAVFVA